MPRKRFDFGLFRGPFHPLRAHPRGSLSRDFDSTGRRRIPMVRPRLIEAVARVGILIALVASPAAAGNPLAPVDTRSPRGVMRTLDELAQEMERVYGALLAAPDPAGQAEAERLIGQLLRLLDVSQIPPTMQRKAGGEAIVFLVDVLHRLEIPSLDMIPDATAFGDPDTPAAWSVPGTEITIARQSKGPRKGEFVFTADTVARAQEFYELVKDLPPRHPTRISDWRQVQIQSHGWMIPSRVVYQMPDVLRRPVLDSPLWKILASLVVLVLAAGGVALWNRLVRPAQSSHSARSYLQRSTVPLLAAAVSVTAGYFITRQLNVIGAFAELTTFATVLSTFVALAWAAWLLTFVVVEWMIATPSIPDESLDANLLRLLGRVLGMVAIVAVLGYGAQQLGVPVFGILAGLGVGGLAFALAARSTVENLIGGLNLYADRPLRIGDFCEYGSIRGTVEVIGLRSTKIRALDRTVTAIPNAELARVHITNYASRDRMLFQHVLDLRYETTTEQLRTVVTQLRDVLRADARVTPDTSTPRVHVTGFGDSSIQVEVCAYVDTREQMRFLAIQEEFMLRMIDVVRAAGADFISPTSTTYIVPDRVIASATEA